MSTEHYSTDPDLTAAEAAAIEEGQRDEKGAQQAAQPQPDPEPEPEPEAQPSAADEAAAKLAEAASKLATVADTLTTAQQQAAAQAQQAQAAAAEEAAARDFEKELAELDQQFEDGDLTQAEYQRRQRAIITEQARAAALEDLRREREREAAEAAKRVEQAAQEQWARATERFFSDPGNAKLVEDPIRQAAFSAAVNLVFAEHNGQIGYDEVLVKARERITGVPAVDAQKAIREAAFQRQQQAGEPPVTLRDVPGAANPDTDPGASLDNLPIDQLEDALARMNEADRQKYLAGAPGGLRDNPRQL